MDFVAFLIGLEAKELLLFLFIIYHVRSKEQLTLSINSGIIFKNE
tara:strand:- start:1448 stop:1582 length:135 start_codon:yes stop_codon:yes gene_type:complete